VSILRVAPEAEIDTLDPDISFRDQIEIDSVDFLQFVLDLEKKLGISIPDVDYPKLSSLNGCLSYIENKSQSN
jgi:acyl carrier protein